MWIEQVDLDDDKTLRACHDLYRAAHKVDDPAGRESPYHDFKVWMAIGWGSEPREVWTLRDADGTVTGWYRLELPDKENLHRCFVEIMVHPAFRRRGSGRALLEHVRGRAAANGRTVVTGGAWQGSAGDEFARAAGAELTLTDIRRVQVLAGINPDTLAMLRAQAQRASDGYSLVRWREPVPEEYVTGFVAVLTGFEDAPRPQDAEKSDWSEQRLHQDIERFKKFGQRGYTVAARHDASGTLAAASSVFISPDDPEWGHQGITAVVREHRGHRLGLLTKIGALDWLAEAEPRLTHIETWNAEVNSYMIAVNEALGYELLGPPNLHYELALAS